MGEGGGGGGRGGGLLQCPIGFSCVFVSFFLATYKEYLRIMNASFIVMAYLRFVC